MNDTTLSAFYQPPRLRIVAQYPDTGPNAVREMQIEINDGPVDSLTVNEVIAALARLHTDADIQLSGPAVSRLTAVKEATR